MNIIEVKDLVKRYGDYTAVDHFDMDIKKGEIVGLLGPNGSGKSTTINCILSLLKYDHGEIRIMNELMKPNSLDIKQHIGVVPQDLAIFQELTVKDNIDFFCGLYISDSKLRKEYVSEAIDFVELNDFKNHYPRELSGGLLRRLNIACGIAHKPSIIILDEPTVAVDPQSRNKILRGIKDLNKDGATIIYTSHYMEEVEELCSKIFIMDKGKKIVSGTAEAIKNLSQYGETISFDIYDLSKDDLNNISNLSFVSSVEYTNNELVIRCNKGSKNVALLLDHLNKESINFVSLRSSKPTLNDVFLEITGKELRDGH